MRTVRHVINYYESPISGNRRNYQDMGKHLRNCGRLYAELSVMYQAGSAEDDACCFKWWLCSLPRTRTI